MNNLMAERIGKFYISLYKITSFFINIMMIEVDKTSVKKMLNAWLNKIPLTIYVFFSNMKLRCAW